VVKTFSNLDVRRLFLLARPARTAHRSALAVAGDDAAAKDQVNRFVDRIGYDANRRRSARRQPAHRTRHRHPRPGVHRPRAN
jgi:hypothetical protein